MLIMYIRADIIHFVPSLRGFRVGNTSPTTQQNQFRAILHFAKCSNTFAFIQHMFLQTNAKSHDILAYAPADLFARYYRFARTTSPTATPHGQRRRNRTCQ